MFAKTHGNSPLTLHMEDSFLYHTYKNEYSSGPWKELPIVQTWVHFLFLTTY